MAEKHLPSERYQLFRKGWQRGASSREIPSELQDDSDFQSGYRKGRTEFCAAMEIARRFYGAPSPSILRVQVKGSDEQDTAGS